MRHRVYGKHLSRSKNERTALFKGLVRALFLNEQIQTTQAKANAIKGLVDKLITQVKGDGPKTLVNQYVSDKLVGEKLITDLAPRLSGRVSGYTSIVKLGVRPGDGAMMVLMKLLVAQKTTTDRLPTTTKKDTKKSAKSEKVEQKKGGKSA